MQETTALIPCRTCGHALPASAYYLISNHAKGGGRLRKECKACTAARALASREVRGTPAQRRTGRKRCRGCGEAVPLEHFAAGRWVGREERAECRGCRGKGPRKPRLATATEETLETRRTRLDLGIAIAHATCLPGMRRTQQELADYAGVTRQAIAMIEQEAVRKVHERVASVLLDAGVTLAELWEVFA